MSRFDALREKVLDDGIIDAEEVEELEAELYDDGIIDSEEANFLFELNDATSGAENDASWRTLFVKAVSDYVLADEVSPGVIDDDEAAYLREKIEADDVVDANELALLVHLMGEGQGAPDDFIAFVLSSFKDAILEDGIIDEAEVKMIQQIIYGSGGAGGEAIAPEEADFLFDLNDAASGKPNHESWRDLFVEAITAYVLEDEISPGAIDADEAEWLIAKIEGDDVYDENEKALLANIKEKATSIDDKLAFKLELLKI